jgi:ribosomal protein S18 acetylase RimI-like enzyme
MIKTIKSAICYQREVGIDASAVADIYRRSTLNRPVDDLQRIQEMLDNSNLIITARCEDKLVGIARSLTDWRYCCYLSDLAVDPDFQGRGIGQRLIAETKKAIGRECKLILLAAPMADSFYAHVAGELGLQVEDVNRTWVIPKESWEK